MTLRTVRISRDELLQIRRIYENVMSYACYGLFFKEGEVLGENISEIAYNSSGGEREKYFELAGNLMAGRGWAEKIKFDGVRVIVDGSIEVEKGAGHTTCHLMRGMIKKIYEGIDHERYTCEEVKCVSKGDEKCVFELQKRGV